MNKAIPGQLPKILWLVCTNLDIVKPACEVTSVNQSPQLTSHLS